MYKEFDYRIGDIPDYEHDVTDIYYDNGHFAEIIIEDFNNLLIEFYPCDEKKNWVSWTHWGIPFFGFIKILEEAMTRLKRLYPEISQDLNIHKTTDDKKNFEFQILDSFNADYHENGVIAYLLYYGDLWLEISHIDGEIVMYICEHPTQKCWQMPYKDAIEALEKIQREIKARQQKK